MDKYSRAYSEASDDVSRKAIRQSMNDMMDSSIKSGLFDAVDIQKMRQVNEKELDKRDLSYDIQNIPDQVDNRYKNGSYSSLTPEEVDKGIALAQRMEEKRRKEIEVANKKMMIQNERSITQEMASGQGKSISEISDMVSDGEISQEFGQAYVMYLTSPDSIDPANDKNGFAKYAENVFSSKDDTQINNAIKMALEGGSDGKISRDDLKYLIKYASDRGNRLTQKNPIQDTIDSAWKTLTDWFSEKSPKNKNTATAEFIKTIASDENADPVKTTQTIINRESVNRNPHVTAIPKEGKIMVDKFGNKARVFPDGSHQEVK